MFYAACWHSLEGPNLMLKTEPLSATRSSMWRELGGTVTGEESYVAVDKGAITDSHVLVLPIEHFPSSLHLSVSTYAEMERYLSALRSCFAAQVQPLRSRSASSTCRGCSAI